MKLSELWLHEWVKPALTREQLSNTLTMSGLEVDSLAPITEKFHHVKVAHILHVEKHPEADRLNVCTVDVGDSAPLTIVCGAKNVKEGMKVPAALPGAVLPGKTIALTDIRGVTSHGMLCSASEIGLTSPEEGLMSLPSDAPTGEDIWDFLKLTDYIMEISITPNRGDCLSVMGLAKEISALTQCEFNMLSIPSVPAEIKDTLPITIQSPVACPHYVGRIIRDVKADAPTPIWLQERLRRSGIRSISPIVDVMNYVMLELGQPMHAFDLNTLSDEIIVRSSHANEELKLLDGQTVKLAPDTLMIADKKNPLAIAGVMGGFDSAVTLLTRDVFLESAFFQAIDIARAGRRYNLGSESSYRFERGIDPQIQVVAIERATALILEIAGGKPGPVIEAIHADYLPKPVKIKLRKERIGKILGINIFAHDIEAILQRLECKCDKINDEWQITVPPRRSDILLEVDLIEEIARHYGYDRIPVETTIAPLQITPHPENTVPLFVQRRALCSLGFQEVITYSFIDKKTQNLFDPDISPKELLNPMTAEMSVMRTSLWPGLVQTLLYNQNRQQPRAKLFETGLQFIPSDNGLLQRMMLSGLATGNAMPEQWGTAVREIDFFDLKGDLSHLLGLTLSDDEFTYQPARHHALHPGQTAGVYRGKELIGYVGALHPKIVQEMGIIGKVYLFELVLDKIQPAQVPVFKEVSRFPEIRRDIAILVNRATPSQAIQDTIKSVGGEWLTDVTVFDVYQGKGIASESKSIALALTIQHPSRTLRDEEVTDLIEHIIAALKEKFAAELRG